MKLFDNIKVVTRCEVCTNEEKKYILPATWGPSIYKSKSRMKVKNNCKFVLCKGMFTFRAINYWIMLKVFITRLL